MKLKEILKRCIDGTMVIHTFGHEYSVEWLKSYFKWQCERFETVTDDVEQNKFNNTFYNKIEAVHGGKISVLSLPCSKCGRMLMFSLVNDNELALVPVMEFVKLAESVGKYIVNYNIKFEDIPTCSSLSIQ